MPHVYDTGLAKPQRTLIRDAVVARLAALKRPTMYLEAVAMIPARVTGRGDDAGIAEILDVLNGRAPALVVALGRAEYAPGGMPASRAMKTIEIAIYAVSNHSRGVVDGRLANDAAAATVTRDPGIETMLEHAEQMLLGKPLGLSDGIQEIRPVSEDELATAKDLTIWEALYSIRVERRINHNRLITEILTEIEAGHRVDGADPANPVYTTRSTLGAP